MRRRRSPGKPGLGKAVITWDKSAQQACSYMYISPRACLGNKIFGRLGDTWKAFVTTGLTGQASGQGGQGN